MSQASGCFLGKGAKAAGEAAGKPPDPRPLTELKNDLVSALRELGHRFVITVDDVDRLEPNEIIEILRLVRSVIDLPNVIYLLCYDGDILGHGIERAVGIESGKAYLEKIIQLTVMVPKPEELQLRQWFTDELHEIAAPKDDEERARLQHVIDYEGDRHLRTPRAVIRALDAIRFFWPSLRDAKADLADLVWLQLIKDGNPQLYRWIEAYTTTVAATSLGTVRIDKAERAQQLASLLASAPEGYFADETFRFHFAEQLAGMSAQLSDGGTFSIFEKEDESERIRALQRKRLRSPDHYRLYFALSNPSHALTPAELTSVSTAAKVGAHEAGEALFPLQDRQIAGTLTKADLFLERLKGGAYKSFDADQCENLLVAFSLVLDETQRRHPADQFWVNTLWDRAQRLIPLLLSRLKPARRKAAITNMFRGPAIGWLTSLLRQETFAHGRHGDRRRPNTEWIFADSELDYIIALMLKRYRAMTIKDVLASSNPASLLFAWNQAGDHQGPRKLVQSSVASKKGLVETLEHLTSIVDSSSRARITILKKENLAPFLDYDQARDRIARLTAQGPLAARARRLMIAFDNAQHF